ncbi:hypothetical protein BJ508DRAFT_315271 [Ascobolus immersus RN42]|uniref:C2H2-type domain-containing protein n=1 Tax=Ascobolus immersus RN42 TaxID=1160509 RepID=A0A3N4HDY0_ASCIM|nr:hypothetical protein BJ508DRAFT_316011 [Ascobolus immersus RN42]RPA71827.1 hypothetical protein BJ508DRAFT_315271 [Ascobolus immersus RN42]
MHNSSLVVLSVEEFGASKGGPDLLLKKAASPQSSILIRLPINSIRSNNSQSLAFLHFEKTTQITLALSQQIEAFIYRTVSHRSATTHSVWHFSSPPSRNRLFPKWEDIRFHRTEETTVPALITPSHPFEGPHHFEDLEKYGLVSTLGKHTRAPSSTSSSGGEGPVEGQEDVTELVAEPEEEASSIASRLRNRKPKDKPKVTGKQMTKKTKQDVGQLEEPRKKVDHIDRGTETSDSERSTYEDVDDAWWEDESDDDQANGSEDIEKDLLMHMVQISNLLEPENTAEGRPMASTSFRKMYYAFDPAIYPQQFACLLPECPSEGKVYKGRHFDLQHSNLSKSQIIAADAAEPPYCAAINAGRFRCKDADCGELFCFVFELYLHIWNEHTIGECALGIRDGGSDKRCNYVPRGLHQDLSLDRDPEFNYNAHFVRIDGLGQQHFCYGCRKDFLRPGQYKKHLSLSRKCWVSSEVIKLPAPLAAPAAAKISDSDYSCTIKLNLADGKRGREICGTKWATLSLSEANAHVTEKHNSPHATQTLRVPVCAECFEERRVWAYDVKAAGKSESSMNKSHRSMHKKLKVSEAKLRAAEED